MNWSTLDAQNTRQLTLVVADEKMVDVKRRLAGVVECQDLHLAGEFDGLRGRMSKSVYHAPPPDASIKRRTASAHARVPNAPHQHADCAARPPGRWAGEQRVSKKTLQTLSFLDTAGGPAVWPCGRQRR